MTTVPAEKKKSLFRGVNRVRVSDFVIAFIILLLSLTCILPFIHQALRGSSGSISSAQGMRLRTFPREYLITIGARTHFRKRSWRELGSTDGPIYQRKNSKGYKPYTSETATNCI